MIQANMTFKSLYAITERRPESRSLSLFTDIRTLYSPAEEQAHTTRMYSSRPCPVILMAGPDSEEARNDDGIRPRWFL